jgi:hypothetical protein
MMTISDDLARLLADAATAPLIEILGVAIAYGAVEACGDRPPEIADAHLRALLYVARVQYREARDGRLEAEEAAVLR